MKLSSNSSTAVFGNRSENEERNETGNETRLEQDHLRCKEIASRILNEDAASLIGMTMFVFQRVPRDVLLGEKTNIDSSD